MKRNNIFITIGITLLTCILLAGVAFYMLCGRQKTMVYINEVCTKNEHIFADQQGHYFDYIELYNASDETLDLTGYGLSDKEDEPYRYTFSNLVLKPGAYFVMTATKNETDLYKTGFGLDADTENMLFLTDNQGRIVDSMVIPALKMDIAYGRTQDDKEEITYLNPSPGASNDTAGVFVDVVEPQFSIPAGFYEEGTELQLTSEQSGLKIYYTMDGTIPNEQSTLYDGQIVLQDASIKENVYRNYTNIVPYYSKYTPPEEPVDKAVVLKAIAYDENGHASDVVTSTYFVGFEDKEAYQNAMIVAISADPDSLFGDENGIYVTGSAYDEWAADGHKGEEPTANYKQKGKESEREAYLELYDSNHKAVLSQNIGIRIQGASSRASSQKRFSLYARKEYGTERYFDYDFWGNGVKTHSLLLRADGGVDAFSQGLMADSAVAVQRGIPVVVFIEGEYWGQYSLQEKYSDDYIEQYYQVDKDNVVIIKDKNLDAGLEGDGVTYWDFVCFIKDHDMADDSNYEKACELMDMESFIEYICFQNYISNMDWSLYKNHMCWRAREASAESSYADGKWRFMLYDCDALGWKEHFSEYCDGVDATEIDAFTAPVPFTKGPVIENELFASLLHNKEFKEQFVETYRRLVKERFTYDKVKDRLNQWQMDAYYDDFFKEREEYAIKYLEENFSE